MFTYPGKKTLSQRQNQLISNQCLEGFFAEGFTVKYNQSISGESSCKIGFTFASYPLLVSSVENFFIEKWEQYAEKGGYHF